MSIPEAVWRAMAAAFCAAIAFCFTGCAKAERPLVLCLPACKETAGNWISLRECLFKQDGAYWLTDASGAAVESFRAGHDGGLLPITVSAGEPSHVSTPLIRKRGVKGVLLHFKRDGVEQTVSLDEAKFEKHRDHDVLFLK
jgi:hypothetical protein